MKQGRVFRPPSAILPPRQAKTHFVVVISNNSSLTRVKTSANGGFVVVAIIRSAKNEAGNPVKMVLGHSFPLTPTDLPKLSHDSIIETHQLFHIRSSELTPANTLGDLPDSILQQALLGAQRLVGP
jgi:hypothetical protein